jgi:hypothetical protein
MAAEIVVILENQDARVFAGGFAIEVGGAEAADTADYHEVVRFTGVHGRAGLLPERAIAHLIGDFERAVMAATHAGQS